jgi:hypothetical protein
VAIGAEVEAVLTAKFAALLPHLDERQRRLATGAEARVLGHGGIKVVARAARVSAIRCPRAPLSWRLAVIRWSGFAALVGAVNPSQSPTRVWSLHCWAWSSPTSVAILVPPCGGLRSPPAPWPRN